ncbi:hypothetical protein BJ170DRAFT_595001 [Xylariales sp. AK1849]|nr:hypothetical protein BJ170DRAFT_595001 [Xylariales sp. AK1849]
MPTPNGLSTPALAGNSRDVEPTSGPEYPPEWARTTITKSPARGPLITNVCRDCQTKKTKCDGKRPLCSRCLQTNRHCDYGTLHKDVTEEQRRETQIDRLSKRVADYEHAFNILKNGTMEEATALLAAIREGDDTKDRADKSRRVELPNSNLLPSPP